MTSGDYRSALAAAIQEYEALGQQRRDIDQRLAQLAQTIGTLSKLLGLVPTVPLGLTDACRLVLRSGLPMTPVEVRDRLLAIGFDLSIYTSDLSAIHTVLKRLNDAGEARFVPQSEGKSAYVWQRPLTAIAIGPEIAEYIRGGGAMHIAGDAREAARSTGPQPLRSRDRRDSRPGSRRRRRTK
jgi:hypothetical protein